LNGSNLLHSEIDENVKTNLHYGLNDLIQLRDLQPSEFLDRLIENFDLFIDIHRNCNYQFMRGCGSYLFDGSKYRYCQEMYEKQKLFYETAKKCDSLLEIGVYMGHSIFIALLANPNIKITCIDIDDKYSRPSLEVIAKHFNHHQITFIQNDSMLALPNLDQKFDMFHIDGDHRWQYLDFEFSQLITKTSKDLVYVVIDDYDAYPTTINKILNGDETYCVINYSIPKCNWRNIVLEVEKINRIFKRL
jgi:hypothetical protein